MATIDFNRLNGPQRKILRETLMGVFSRRALELFLTDYGFETLEDIVDPGPFKFQVHDLIEALSRVGHLSRLVDAIQTEFPDAPAIEDLSLRLGFVDAAADHQRVLGGGGLEKMVRAAGFEDLNPWTDRLSAAGRRVCRISYDLGHTIVHGTGFLIAKDLVLTNYHVIEDVLEGRAEADRVRLSFGYAESSDGPIVGTKYWLAQEWIVAHAPYSDADLVGGAEVPQAEELDFALLRLEKPAGEEEGPAGKRGWFDLANASLPSRQDAVVFVLQHPEGQPLKQAIGILQESETRLRLRYDADTESGSSGGLVLDQQLRPIALHHAGDPQSKIKARYNQGIPLSLIHAALEHESGPLRTRRLTRSPEAPEVGVPVTRSTSRIGTLHGVERMMPPQPAQVEESPESTGLPLLFFSCAPEDESLRADLAKHLKLLERQRLLRTWYSGEVALGADSDLLIQRKLQEADIILLLVSSDYQASDELWERDLKIALQRHERHEARVIPILLGTIEWETMPFRRLQPLPRDRRAIAGRSKAERDRIFSEVASAIREIVTGLTAGRQN